MGQAKIELQFFELFESILCPAKKKNHSKSNDLKWFSWQREKDSNPHIRSQSPLCYLYTIPLNAKSIIQHVEEFFARYEADPALQARVEEALACYPGSLELRESVVENVLLPIASGLGLPFTVDELRAYETRKKLHNMKPDVAVEEGEPVEDPPTYWLLESGWEWDDEPIRKKEALLRDIAGI